MAQVWAARMRGTRGFQKLVAIKTLAAEDALVDRLEPMLLAEAQLAAQIHHPNVAQYLDLGERAGMLFVVMEWVDGESLTHIIKRAAQRGGVPLAISAQIVAQACNGLHGAHELRDGRGDSLGLVHCDVSPHNIMVSATGAVKIIDFGIAKAARGAPMEGHDGMVAGKLAFMAPEQARGENVDRRADIFSLGIILYLLTTGRHPFGSGTAQETLERILRDSPVIPPCAADPRYSPALQRVVMRALEHDREKRFASAAEMLYELGAAVDLAHEIEVGAFIDELCHETLVERRARVNEALDLAAQREESTQLEEVRVSFEGPPSSSDLPALHHVSTTAPAMADVFAPTVPPAQSHRRSFVWLTLVAAAALALGVISYRVNPIVTAMLAVQKSLASLTLEQAAPSTGAALPAAAPGPSQGSQPLLAPSSSSESRAVAEVPEAAPAQPASSAGVPVEKRKASARKGRANASSAKKIIEHYGI
jgi:serine/threonine-protein kinase